MSLFKKREVEYKKVDPSKVSLEEVPMVELPTEIPEEEPQPTYQSKAVPTPPQEEDDVEALEKKLAELKRIKEEKKKQEAQVIYVPMTESDMVKSMYVELQSLRNYLSQLHSYLKERLED